MKSLTRILILLFLFLITRICIAQESKSKVIVKVTKIVGEDTSVTEKIINESDMPFSEKETTTTKDGKKVTVKILVSKESDVEPDYRDVMKNFDFNFMMDSMGGSSMFMKKEFVGDSLLNFGGTGMEELIKKLNFMFPEADSGQTFQFNLNEDSLSKFIMKSVQDLKTGKPAYLFSEDDNGSSGTYAKTVVKIIDLDDKNGKKKSYPDLGKVDFYPNPNSRTFNLDLEVRGKENTAITILDSKGNAVYRDEVKGKGKHSRQIELGGNNKGVYLLKLKQGDKESTKKLIIE